MNDLEFFRLEWFWKDTELVQFKKTSGKNTTQLYVQLLESVMDDSYDA